MNIIAVVLKKSLFGLLGILLIAGFAYTESTFNSSSQSEDSSGAPSIHLTSPDQLWALASGIKPGIRMGPSYTVKSDLYEDRWYVGAKVYHVPHGELEVATWIMTGSKSNPELVLSADSAAQALSIWPSPQGRISVSEGDAEVRALRTALKER